MLKFDISERVKKIKETYMTLPVVVGEKHEWYYTHDRWMSLAFLEGWLNNDNALTTTMRRSLAERAELDAAEPIIYDDELILGHLYFPKYSSEEQERYENLSKAFLMSSSTINTELYRARPDHIGLNYKTLLDIGINGLIDKIKDKKSKLRANDDMFDSDKSLEAEEFYDCCIIELEGVLALAQRYAKKAEELAKTASESRKSELLLMSGILKQVPANPARTFREALQSMHFFTFNLFGLYPVGRPDRLLADYYENDINNGILTQELAQELVDNYCLLISDYVFHRAANGFIVGGRRADGSVVENDLTYMFLTALEHIRMPDPNGALAVCSDTSDEIISYGVDIVAKGVTHPAFYNDDAITSALINEYGVSKDDAYEYIHTTCAEISVIGKSRTYTTCHVTILPEVVKDVVFANANASFDEILYLMQKELYKIINKNNREYMTKILEASRNGLQPMRVSCLIDDCIEKGKHVYQGGARYNFLQPIFIGFSNAVDSLVTIKKLVFEEGKFTLSELSEIIKNNFEGNETLRLYIVNKLPHYGNDIEVVDKLAEKIAKMITDIFKDKTTYMYKYSMPGTFSYDMHACGERFGATFDGRKAGMSFADGCCPVQGYDTNGPTALIKSLTSWDQSTYLAGMVVNMKFNKSNFTGEKQKNLVQLLRTFVNRGGLETQINVVDKATLLAAREHPEKYRDLLVRIGGYSDYFVTQNPVMMQEIIDRTEN